MRRYSTTEARDHLAALVHEAESGARAELTRRGRSVAVVMSVDAHRRPAGSPAGNFWNAYERFRESADLAGLGIEPWIFEGIRDRSPGREPV